MRVKGLVWIFVFMLSFTLVNALTINSPLNNSNISYASIYNFTNNTYSLPVSYYGLFFNGTNVNNFSNVVATTNDANLTTTGASWTLVKTYNLNNRLILPSISQIIYEGAGASAPYSMQLRINYTNGSNYNSSICSFTDSGVEQCNPCTFTANITNLVPVNAIEIYVYDGARAGNVGLCSGSSFNIENSSSEHVFTNPSIYNYISNIGRYTLNISAFNSSNVLIDSNTTFVNVNYNSLLNVTSNYPSNITVNGVSCQGTVCSFDVLRSSIVSVRVDNSSYSLNVSNVTIPNYPSYVYNVSLLPNNAINISIFKESDGSKLYGNASLSFVGDSGIVFYDTINQTKLYSNLTSDNYSIGFTQSGYSIKSYRLNLVNRTFNNLNVYLNNGSSVLFNFKTNTGTALSGVELQVYTFVNGSSVLVESSSSDITGKIQIALEGSKYYSFIAIKEGYNTYSFVLNPVLFTSYDVVMTPSGSGSTIVPSAQVTFSPTSFFRFQNVNFNIQFVSQYNNLVAYRYNVTYPTGSVAGSGTNSHGQNLNSTFVLNPLTINSNVTIYYEYNLSNGVYYNATYRYPVVYTYSNRTWVTMGNTVNASTGQDSVTGYYVGERVLIVTFISLIMFGVGWVIGGAVPGLVFAIIPIMFFINSGFVPKQLYYITFFFMVIYFIGRGSDS